jgi:chromosome segregation ATPase
MESNFREAHYAEAYHHCRRSLQVIRPQLESAVRLAQHKDQQRRLLARELAAANLKVRILSASVEELQEALRAERGMVARLRSECSEIGL